MHLYIYIVIDVLKNANNILLYRQIFRSPPIAVTVEPSEGVTVAGKGYRAGVVW